MFTNPFYIRKAIEHTCKVRYQTTDTIRTVLNVLRCIVRVVIQLDLVGYIESTVQAEYVLVVTRIILHRLVVVERVRETYIILFCGVCDRKVVRLRHTSTEDIRPLVVVRANALETSILSSQ